MENPVLLRQRAEDLVETVKVCMMFRALGALLQTDQ